jgi:predicted ATPase
MIHLRSIKYQPKESLPNQYPFNLKIIKDFVELSFTSPVTFFVGENGSGKSTLLESIALATNAITIGSVNGDQDRSLDSTRSLSRHLKTVWNQNTHRGFFLRAEDFFGYTRKLAQTKEEIQKEIDSVPNRYSKRSSYAAELAKLPHKRDLNELDQRYGNKLEAASHGESFLNFFQTRFVPNGLYLLDEPEAALSPISQLAFLSITKQMVEDNAQFVIATHSPILMAFPNAVIYDFDSTPIQTILYDQVKHVEIMKGFLESPQSYLKYL